MLWHTTKRVLITAMLLLIVGASGLVVIAKVSGDKLLSVQTGSMVPTIQKGSLVSVERVPVQSLRVGDIITFINPLDSSTTLTHRIVQLPSARNEYRFVTKGDANKATDMPINASAIIGRERSSIVYIGYFADFIRQPTGLMLIIYLPAMMIVGEEFKRLLEYYRTQQPYVAINYRIRRRQSHQHYKLIGLASASASLVLLTSIMALPADAVLNSTVKLTGTTIQTKSLTPPLQQCSGDNNNSVNVTSNSSQFSSTGNANTSGNTNSGSASSGNASNSNSSTVTININNC